MLLVSCSEAYEMTTHMDHHTENPHLSFPLATADNVVNHMCSCNHTSITNILSILTQRRLLETDCDEDARRCRRHFMSPVNWCYAVLTRICLSSPLHPSWWNTASVETLEGSHPEDALTQSTSHYLCKDQDYTLPMSNQ